MSDERKPCQGFGLISSKNGGITGRYVARAVFLGIPFMAVEWFLTMSIVLYYAITGKKEEERTDGEPGLRKLFVTFWTSGAYTHTWHCIAANEVNAGGEI